MVRLTQTELFCFEYQMSNKIEGTLILKLKLQVTKTFVTEICLRNLSQKLVTETCNRHLLQKLVTETRHRNSSQKFVTEIQKTEDSTKSGGTYLNINGQQSDHVYIKALCIFHLFSSKLSRISSGDE